MTPDQGPSHFNPSLPEIPWRTRVIGNDLRKIRNHLRRGNSLPTSVALVIIDESYSLVTPQADGYIGFSVINNYRAASAALVGAERFLRTGRRILTMETFEGIASLREQKDPEEATDILVFAAQHHIEQQILDRVLREHGALDFIDFFTDLQLQHLEEVSPAFTPELIDLWKEAVRQGQNRFRQLYQAAREQELG